MLDIYHKILKQNLTEKRYTHCVNVAQKAVYLAKRYGADVNKAEIAGLLHDVTKQMNDELQLKIISDAGTQLSPIEIKNKKLWHAVSGSAYLKVKLGIDDKEILNAVRFHTTGRAKMSLLEKIIFVADMISDDRNFVGINVAREIAEKNLDKAVCLTSILSIKWLMEKKAIIAPNTLDAYNDTVKSLI